MEHFTHEQIGNYLKKYGFEQSKSNKHGLDIFYKRYSDADNETEAEIILPKNFFIQNYYELIKDALRIISNLEGIPMETILQELENG